MLRFGPANLRHLLRAAALAAAFGAGVPARAEPRLSEFMASNQSALADDDGEFSDWIEIHNPDATPASLAGWHLTDSAKHKAKWTFPAVTVPAGGYLVVFASGKDRRVPGRTLHTNFSLDADGEYLALVRADGVSAASELPDKFPPQLANVSYGFAQTATGPAAEMSFLRQPTPGAANSDAGSPVRGEVEFSRAAGLFTEPFAVTLSGAGAGENIRYVLVPVSSKGALVVPAPTAASPRYTGPLTITESVIIRAAIFSSDDRSSGESTTVHYAKLATTGAQRADTFTSALPAVVLGLHGYGPIEDFGVPLAGWTHLFTPAAGAAAFAGAPALSSAADLTVRGNSSAAFPKKGFNVDLLTSTGGENRQELLGLAASDAWALVSPWNFDRAYVRNAFAYALSNRLGRWAPQTRFVEVFFDGDGTLDASDYAGVSVLTERLKIDGDRIDIAELSPSDTTAPAVTGGYLLKIDVPDRDQWSFVTERGIPSLDSAAVVVVSPKADKLPQAQRDYIRGYVQGMENALFAGRASGWRDRSYLDYVDLASWVDQHLLQVFSGNIDALSHSDYFHKDRGGRIVAGPLWDFDRAFGSYDPRARNFDTWSAGPVDVWSYGWYGVIATDPEFMQAWIDRWQSLRQTELGDAALGALADTLASSVTPEAAARDAARWPDNASPTGGGFAGEIARLKTWLRNRAGWIDRQFLAAPAKSVAGDAITFTAPAGAVLAYTLDGSDPRSLGGDVAPNALLTSAPLTVPASANVHVRSYRSGAIAFPGSPWSSAVGGAAASPLAPAARLINISTRGLVGDANNPLIVGVVLADTAAKPVLARAIGPTLAEFGAAGTVPDPQLGIRNNEGVEIFRNNGWQNGAAAAQLPALARGVGAFPLAAGSADSALAPTLGRGAYTMQVSSPSGRGGVALAELYELDGAGRTVNLSTRAYVGTGGNVLIGGFVVQGPAYKRMLIRAVGPTLGAFGLDHVLADPVLTLYSGSAVVATNDRWSASPDAVMIAAATKAVGGFALIANGEDAALLITVPPGAYTVEVRGKNATEGVGLLEIYEIP